MVFDWKTKITYFYLRIKKNKAEKNKSYEIKVTIRKYFRSNESPDVSGKSKRCHEDFTPEGILIETVFLGDKIPASPICEYHGQIYYHGKNE